MPTTGPSEKTRREVFARDNVDCQFWHREPVEATKISHMIHQGPGGLPPEHELNQPGNLASSCSECHRRFPPNGRWRWRQFEPIGFGVDHVGQRMVIESPSGKVVPKRDLWFYNRWRWKESEAKYLELENWIAKEHSAAWKAAELIAWFKDHGIAHAAVSEAADYLDVAADVGLSSGEAKKRKRVAGFRGGLAVPGQNALDRVSLDVADRLRKIPDDELVAVAGWFADLPPAEAWSRFNEKYPGPEKRKTYRIFTGAFREESAAEDDAIITKKGEVVVKGGSVIRGPREEIEKEAE